MKDNKKRKHSFFDLGTKVVFKGKGPTDGSINHDKNLYEFEYKKWYKK